MTGRRGEVSSRARAIEWIRVVLRSIKTKRKTLRLHGVYLVCTEKDNSSISNGVEVELTLRALG